MAEYRKNRKEDRAFTPEDERRYAAMRELEKLYDQVVEQNKGPCPTLASIELEPIVSRAREVAQLLFRDTLSDEERRDLEREYLGLVSAIEDIGPEWQEERKKVRSELKYGIRKPVNNSTIIFTPPPTLQ